jgi:hypothetical protein
MTRTVTIDLDDPSDLQRVVERAEALRTLRAMDPEIRSDILRLARQMPPEEGDEIREALRTTPPALVLAGFFDALYTTNLRTTRVPERRSEPCSPTYEAPPQGESVEAYLTAFVRNLLEAGCSILGLIAQAALLTAYSRRLAKGDAENVTAKAMREACRGRR